MAFGFSPKHEITIEIKDLTNQEFIVIAFEIAKKLEWNISLVTEKSLVAYTKFSMSSYSEEVKIVVNENIATIKSQCTGSQIIDYGKNRRNLEDFVTYYNQLKSSFSKDQLATKTFELKETSISSEQANLNETPLSRKEKITGFLSIFKPNSGFFITPIVLDLNILVFIIMVVSGVNLFMPETEDLLNWGANFKPSTLDGQWWRLFTSTFLHIGVIHLLMNMYALLYIGVLLEPLLGKARFLSAYIVSGIAASLTSLMWHDFTVSAGASGAIFGMYGVFLAMLTTNHIEKSARKSLLTSIGVFVGYNLLTGMKGGVDNAAHIGGLLSGVVIGYVFYPSLKETNSKKRQKIGISFISTAIIVATVVICTNTSNDIALYDNKIKEFSLLEDKALAIYNLPEGTSDKKILELIKTQGINNWESCIKIITDIEKLDLPVALQDRSKLLKYYAEVRLNCYKLLDKAISENTDRYKSEIDSCNVKIDRVIKTLSEQ